MPFFFLFFGWGFTAVTLYVTLLPSVAVDGNGNDLNCLSLSRSRSPSSFKQRFVSVTGYFILLLYYLLSMLFAFVWTFLFDIDSRASLAGCGSQHRTGVTLGATGHWENSSMSYKHTSIFIHDKNTHFYFIFVGRHTPNVWKKKVFCILTILLPCGHYAELHATTTLLEENGLSTCRPCICIFMH